MVSDFLGSMNPTSQLNVSRDLSMARRLQQSFQFTDAQQDERLKKAAQDFESVLFKQMLEAMDKTVDREDSLFHGGHAEDTFRSMMNEEIAKDFTTQGAGLGLAQIIYQQTKETMTLQSQGTHRGERPVDPSTGLPYGEGMKRIEVDG